MVNKIWTSLMVLIVNIQYGFFAFSFDIDKKSPFKERSHIFSYFADKNKENPVEPPLLIGSFNIQTLGKKKFKNPDVIYTVKKIVHRYDLILLLEIMTKDPSFMKDFLRDVNRFAPDRVVYNMTLSDRHPDTMEHCAFLYRTNKLNVIKSESYSDPSKYYRKPFVVVFEAFTLRDMKRFGVVGHHVKPSQAVKELNALADLYDSMKEKHKLKDVLLMGDFNADCTYVREQDWENIGLWTRPEFTWAITSGTDTTTNYRSCTLDRFVYAGEKMNDAVILSSAKIFNFQQEFDLSLEETRNISDHWPIEIKLRGKMSKVAEEHLITDVCFKIRDSRSKANITIKYVIKLAKDSHFIATTTSDGVSMFNRTIEKRDLLAAVTKLGLVLPNVMTHELKEAIKYKLNHGSLEDKSAFADVWDPSYKINVTLTSKHTEALVCKTTTVN